jgi:hypothetical protein
VIAQVAINCFGNEIANSAVLISTNLFDQRKPVGEEIDRRAHQPYATSLRFCLPADRRVILIPRVIKNGVSRPDRRTGPASARTRMTYEAIMRMAVVTIGGDLMHYFGTNVG